MVRTFRNIINDIEGFCTNHNQIREFGWGQLDNITTKDHDFTMLWLQPTNTSIDGHLMTLSFDMYIFDLVKQDNSNLLDVMNDTLLIGNDVISKFWDNEEEYEWMLNEEGVSAEPFEAKFDDYTAGWIFSIEIELENRLNLCAIPENLTEPEPTETLYYVRSQADIFGDGLTISWNSSTEYATYTEFSEIEPEPPISIGDKVYLGYSPTNVVATGYTCTDKVYDGTRYYLVDIDNPTAKQQGYERVAKLTPFTSADYGTPYTGSQDDNTLMKFVGDLTTEFSENDNIRITNAAGQIFYGIVYDIGYKSGYTNISTYMGRFAPNLGILTIEKMTNIV